MASDDRAQARSSRHRTSQATIPNREPKKKKKKKRKNEVHDKGDCRRFRVRMILDGLGANETVVRMAAKNPNESQSSELRSRRIPGRIHQGLFQRARRRIQSQWARAFRGRRIRFP